MNDREVVELMAYVSAGWPSWAIPEGDAALAAARRFWRNVLADVDLDAAVTAVEVLAREGSRFAPGPGEIAKRAIHLTTPGVPDVDQAMTEVLDRIRDVGFNGGPGRWSHPAIGAAVDAITWWRLCYDDNQPALWAQFRDAYRPAAERATREQTLPPSARALEAHAAAIGRRGELEG